MGNVIRFPVERTAAAIERAEQAEKAANSERMAKLVADMAASKGRNEPERERLAKLAAEKHYTGTRYDRDRDVKDIAKLLRKDIKAAVKAGSLPRGKYQVRISRYSMGQSISVDASELDGIEVANMARFRAEARNPALRHLGTPVGKLKSDAAYAVEAKLTALMSAYNFDKSDSMTDYYNSAFAGFVDVVCNFDAARELAESELREAQ